MSKRFMSWNGDASSPSYWWHEGGGEVAVEMVQDMEEIFRRNHAIREHLNPNSPDGDYRMDSSIPVTVIEIWRKLYGIDFYKMSDPDQMEWIDKNILNSNEWYKLRTSKGQL